MTLIFCITGILQGILFSWEFVETFFFNIRDIFSVFQLEHSKGKKTIKNVKNVEKIRESSVF